jgi:hypothetical protein
LNNTKDICELKLTELSRRLNANKNYVLRLLATPSPMASLKNRYSGGYHIGHAPKLSRRGSRVNGLHRRAVTFLNKFLKYAGKQSIWPHFVTGESCA